MRSRTMFKHHHVMVEISIKLSVRQRYLYFQAGVMIEVGRDAQKPMGMSSYALVNCAVGPKFGFFFLLLPLWTRVSSFILIDIFQHKLFFRNLDSKVCPG